MKQNISIIIISLLLTSFAGKSILSINQKKKNMENITFIPKEFNEIELGYDCIEMVKTSPGYPNELIKINKIAINTPEFINYSDLDSNFKPIVPLSAIYVVSSQRTLKYIHLIAKLIHVKNIKSGVEFLGEICKKENPNISEYPLPKPNIAEFLKEREELIKQAQKLTDEEIDNRGKTIGDFMNINIMEYVDFPFLPGKYEIWLSFSGLESNHTVVEIVKK